MTTSRHEVLSLNVAWIPPDRDRLGLSKNQFEDTDDRDVIHRKNLQVGLDINTSKLSRYVGSVQQDTRSENLLQKTHNHHGFGCSSGKYFHKYGVIVGICRCHLERSSDINIHSLIWCTGNWHLP